MSRYMIRDQHGLNFVTMTTVGWVDIFTRRRYKDIIIDCLKYSQQHKQLQIFAYVIMSNHVHFIVRAEGETSLTDILRDFKKFTANTILKQIKNGQFESRKDWILQHLKLAGDRWCNRKLQFWQTGYHPIELYSASVIAQKIRYIHYNPVKAGWVDEPQHYLYSSASNYVSGTGVLDVEVLLGDLQ
ncbi:MAG: transposase [Bacteroidota bacterium]